MGLFHLLLVVFIVGCVPFSVGYDWDWMPCLHNGTYLGHYAKPTPEHDHCNCTKGWSGLTCGICGSNDICTQEVRKDKLDAPFCDKSMFLTEFKRFSCTTQEMMGYTGSLVLWANFSDPDDGSLIVNVFAKPTGAPQLFNCTFNQCTKEVDDEFQTLHCLQAKCHCTSWCGIVIKAVVNAMKGWGQFRCDTSQGSCELTQEKMPFTIQAACNASSCSAAHYQPLPKTFTVGEILSFLLVGGLVLLVASFFCICAIISNSKRSELRKDRLWTTIERPVEPVSLSFSGISCVLRKRHHFFWNRFIKPWSSTTTVVLQDISAHCNPGELTAILGPTGAGKTTLLDILAGRKTIGTIYGEVFIGGTERKRRTDFKKISGYVLQDERMIGTQTVREHLMAAAIFKLPRIMPNSMKRKKVENVMKDLGIYDRADQLIGTDLVRGLSGGEKKRLSIASELVTDPSVLLLDEPTSGLDSSTAKSLVETLRKLASERGCTIIMTIHQPRSNIFDCFDQLILLAKGRAIYSGLRVDAIEYMANLGYTSPKFYNPADFLIDLLVDNDHLVDELATSFSNSDRKLINNDFEDQEDSETDYSRWRKYTSGKYSSSRWTQFGELSKRTLKNILRDPHLIALQYSLVIGLALLLGWIYWDQKLDLPGVQNRAGCIFFILSMLSFAAMGSIDMFFQERAIFVRERADGMYSSISYFLAKSFCDIIPLRVFPPIILGSIVYYMVGLMPPIHNFLFFLFGVTLVSFCAGSMCLAIGSVTPSVGVGNLVCIIILLFNMLFAGFLLNKTRIPPFISSLKYVSFIQYGFEALVVNELVDRTNLKISAPDISKDTLILTGRQLLAQFGLNPSLFYFDFAVLIGMSCFFLLISYLFIRFLVKEKR